jgi:hypothetical protein
MLCITMYNIPCMYPIYRTFLNTGFTYSAKKISVNMNDVCISERSTAFINTDLLSCVSLTQLSKSHDKTGSIYRLEAGCSGGVSCVKLYMPYKCWSGSLKYTTATSLNALVERREGVVFARSCPPCRVQSENIDTRNVAFNT